MNNLSQKQSNTIARNGLAVREMVGSDVVCGVSHPNGVADVYIALDGSIRVEDGDDLDGYELVPLADSFMAGLLSD